MYPHRFRLGEFECSSHTIPQLVNEVRELLSDKTLRPRSILCVNAHIYNMAWSDRELRDAICEARIVAMDGMSIVAAARLFGERALERCNMTEAFRAFLRDALMPGNKGLLVGSTEEEVRTAACEIERISPHCKIERSISGFLDSTEYERLFSEHGDIDFIFIGMGTPRTEIVSKIAHRICPNAIVWGIGGGTIRIFAGRIKEAPVLFRRCGLQWFHRLCMEPTRLWQRYIIGNPLFVYRILKSVRKRKARRC